MEEKILILKQAFEKYLDIEISFGIGHSGIVDNSLSNS
jgi:hypothetical protein